MYVQYFIAFTSAILFMISSVNAAHLPERLSDRLISSQRVDEALEVCDRILGDRLRANQIPVSAFQVCIMAYVKKLARDLDGVDLIFPKSFS